jgi:hypothetical protein
VPPYHFLFDRDVEAAADALPASRVLTLERVGLPATATDEAIIDKASEKRCIIVTANGRDFLPAPLQYIKQSRRRVCHDLNGLVVLPTGLEPQRRLLREAPQRMRFGGVAVTWADVWARNHYVRLVRNGPAEVKLLPRCTLCMKNEVARENRRGRRY